MSVRPYRVLLACYGGGHVQSLIPVAHALQNDRHIALTVLGFTTARAVFERAGVKAESYTVLEQYLTHSYAKLAEPFVSDLSHPDVKRSESLAYFQVGLHDLIETHGKDEALRLVRRQGRVAFRPEMTFRRYLEATLPDLVITSTSPRSELALQRAARTLGIPGLAISDLFLQHEASYLCDIGYAQHISVIAGYVADFLRDQGCRETKLYVTGNPAFDELFSDSAKIAGKKIQDRFSMGGECRLITWIATPHDVSLRGKPFIPSAKIIEYLESFCDMNPGHKFAIRPHPNRPIELPENCRHGVLLDNAYSIESVLWASDVVSLETSTVGLQAALIGRPVVTINSENYPPYASLGLATDVPNLEALGSVLMNPDRPDLLRLRPAGLGDATTRVLQVIDELLGRRKEMERST